MLGNVKGTHPHNDDLLRLGTPAKSLSCWVKFRNPTTEPTQKQKTSKTKWLVAPFKKRRPSQGAEDADAEEQCQASARAERWKLEGVHLRLARGRFGLGWNGGHMWKEEGRDGTMRCSEGRGAFAWRTLCGWEGSGMFGCLCELPVRFLPLEGLSKGELIQRVPTVPTLCHPEMMCGEPFFSPSKLFFNPSPFLFNPPSVIFLTLPPVFLTLHLLVCGRGKFRIGLV